MSRKHIVALMLLFAVGILFGGCGPAEEPAEEPTREEQPAVTSEPRPDTPIIILERRASTTLTDWTYKKKESDPPAVQSKADQSMFSECAAASLRTDFIGSKVLQFVYLSKGDTDWAKAKDATKIVAKKSGVKVEITAPADGGARFYIEDSNCTHCSTCIAVADPSGQVETGTVPPELYDLNWGDLKHEENGVLVSIEKFKLVIQL